MELWMVLVAVAVVLAVAAAWLAAQRPAGPPAVEAPQAWLAERLGKTRQALGERLTALFGRGRLDEGFWSALEEALVAGDVGVATAEEVVGRVRARHPADGTTARQALEAELRALFDGPDRSLSIDGSPAVIVVVGVNGVGKTTSIAKLAARLDRAGRSALLGGADTFRAAADTQLLAWADRAGVEVVSGAAGADPAAVAFDAYQAARARGRDVVIIDTAGRLHSQRNLMEELGKVVGVLRREASKVDEVLLVLDATIGQNAVAQAGRFTEAVGVTGIVLTKMDGTARGGVVVPVEREVGVPVKFIGVGEGLEDLIPFDPNAFVRALLS